MKHVKLWTPLLLLAAAAPVVADVDLVTIPRREATQLTIYNSEDITMVREHRLLTVKKGINRIQFTWANTLIDPISIDFRIFSIKTPSIWSIPRSPRAATTLCNGTSVATWSGRFQSRSAISPAESLGRLVM